VLQYPVPILTDMCTLSRFNHDNGYTLFFNRDEQKSRRDALPSSLAQIDDVSYLAPTDTNAGGTWIFVNEHGVTAAILNHYESTYTPPPTLRASRGLLLRRLASISHAEKGMDMLCQLELEPYPPFYVAICSKTEPLSLARWDGESLDITYDVDEQLPLSTSSYKPQEVIAERKKLYHKLCEEGPVSNAILDRYHRSHDPDHSAFSVCMLRSDAETLSTTVVSVDATEASMTYRPKLRGTFTFGEASVAVLPLRTARSRS